MKPYAEWTDWTCPLQLIMPRLNHRPVLNDEMPKRCSAKLINLVDAAGFCSANAQRQDRLFNRKFT